MTLEEYLSLRNGTDVRGIASEGVEGEPVTLTAEAVENIAKAFASIYSVRLDKEKLTVAVGYDSRISAEKLCNAVVRGITSLGHDVIVTGLSTTPSMFMLLQDEGAEYKCDVSMMITASHLPFNRNGLKFFNLAGGLESADVKEILTLAASESFPVADREGERREYAYLDRYAAQLVELVRKETKEELPLAGKNIVVDAGNGAGGFFAYKVLAPLGASTLGSQFLTPDGMFPHHIPNPENKAAMRSVCEAVKAANADFGIIFDTDVDRAGAVDKNGEEINRNRLIALIAAILLSEKPGTIVTDSVTSDGLTEFIKAKGGRHHRFKRGYKNVINEAKRLLDEGEYAPLAIETSGHAALLENYFLDDGAYLITRLLIALAKASREGKELTDLISDLKTPAQAIEVRLRFVNWCDFKAEGKKLLEDFEDFEETLPYATLPEENYEGCRVSYDESHGDGWALLRMSLHEPILPINVESNQPHGGLKILKHLYDFLRQYHCLDLTALQDAIEQCRAELLNDAKRVVRQKKRFLF